MFFLKSVELYKERFAVCYYVVCYCQQTEEASLSSCPPTLMMSRDRGNSQIVLTKQHKFCYPLFLVLKCVVTAVSHRSPFSVSLSPPPTRPPPPNCWLGVGALAAPLLPSDLAGSSTTDIVLVKVTVLPSVCPCPLPKCAQRLLLRSHWLCP